MISIVIPVYNGERTIGQALEAVFGQTYAGEVEVIVIDDGSTDNTGEVVKSTQRVRYVHQDNSGPAAARNVGASLARGEVIFFTDADCQPSEHWLEKTLPHFEDDSIAVVAGSYDVANPESILARFIHREIMYRHEKRMPRFPRFFGSYNFAIRKSVFREVGGFDATYRYPSGEDNDFSYKLRKAGYKIYFEPESKVKHYHTVSILKYLKEQFRHGVWRVKMYRAHPDMRSGDDYTFWKDIVEPVIVMLILLSLLLVPIDPTVSGYFWSMFLLGLFTLEIYFAWLFSDSFKDAIFSACAMTSRAFARTLGFLYGLIYFSSKNR